MQQSAQKLTDEIMTFNDLMLTCITFIPVSVGKNGYLVNLWSSFLILILGSPSEFPHVLLLFLFTYFFAQGLHSTFILLRLGLAVRLPVLIHTYVHIGSTQNSISRYFCIGGCLSSGIALYTPILCVLW